MNMSFATVVEFTTAEITAGRANNLPASVWVLNTTTNAVSQGNPSGAPSLVQTSGNQPLNNFAATTAPTINDDSGDGYVVGSRWVDVTGDESYICVDVTVGAAVWSRTTVGTIAEVSGLQAALDAKAPTASPALTGVPTTSTAAVGTNTTQIASTAFVQAEIADDLATVAPLIDGVAAVGTSVKMARQDHVHPTDSTRAPVASPTLTGTIIADGTVKLGDGQNLGDSGSPAASATTVFPNVASTASSTIQNTDTALRVSRPGTSGTKWPNAMDVNIGSHTAGLNSQTQVDFRLNNGGIGTPDMTALTLKGNGEVLANGSQVVRQADIVNTLISTSTTAPLSANQGKVLQDGKADASTLTSHTGNVSNPHTVTKAQVGLANADNTADVNKPISTAQQTALDAKQATLVSGTNIRTVNGASLLGSTNLAIDVAVFSTTTPSVAIAAAITTNTILTATSWGQLHAVDASAGNLVIFLPSANGQTGDLVIRRIDNTANTVWVFADMLDLITGIYANAGGIRVGGLGQVVFRALNNEPFMAAWDNPKEVADLWTPTTANISTIRGWWDARALTGITDAGDIDTLTDSSGAGNSLAQATAANKAIYRAAAANLGGLPAYELKTASRYDFVNTYRNDVVTGVFLIRTPATLEADGRIWGETAGDGIGMRYGSGVGTVNLVDMGQLHLTGATTDPQTSTTELRAAQFDDAANAGLYHRNGAADGTLAYATDVTDSVRTIQLFDEASGSRATAGMQFSGLVLAHAALSTADMERIEAILAWRAGLQATLLPVGHTYRNLPPMTSLATL